MGAVGFDRYHILGSMVSLESPWRYWRVGKAGQPLRALCQQQAATRDCGVHFALMIPQTAIQSHHNHQQYHQLLKLPKLKCWTRWKRWTAFCGVSASLTVSDGCDSPDRLDAPLLSPIEWWESHRATRFEFQDQQDMQSTRLNMSILIQKLLFNPITLSRINEEAVVQLYNFLVNSVLGNIYLLVDSWECI